MLSQSKWMEDIGTRIETLKNSLTPKEYKKFKLDYLLRLAGKVAEFSEICPECQPYRADISGLLDVPVNAALMNRDDRKQYSRKMNEISKHLKKTHKLVSAGQYVSILSGIGWAMGTALGAALDSFGIETSAGMFIGIALGYGVGFLLDRKAKKEGRVI